MTARIAHGVFAGLVIGLAAAAAGLVAGGEDMGPWFFAHLDDGFIVPGRSILYQLMVSPFLTLPAPWSLAAEMVTRSMFNGAILGFALPVLFGRRGLLFLWLLAPGLMITAPATQTYAVSLALAAWALRRQERTVLSYAVLLVTLGLRSNYQLLMITLLTWDGICLFLAQDRASRLRRAVPAATILVVLVMGWSWLGADQANHRWNNYFYISTDWLPYDATKVGAGHFSQAIAYNFRERQGAPRDIPFDTWHMHAKLFGNAQTTAQMVVANPGEWGPHILRNLRGMTSTVADLTALGHVLFDVTRPLGLDHRIISAILFPGLSLVLVATLWVLARTPEGRRDVPFILGFVVVAGSALLVSGSKDRFFHPLLPVFAMMAWQVGRAVVHRSRKFGPMGALLVALALLPQAWLQRMPAFAAGIGDFPNSLRTRTQADAIAFVDTLQGRCHGLISVDAMRLATFSQLPEGVFHDIFTIPPFGRLDDGTYKGLTSERIDCVHISPSLLNSLDPESEPVTNIRIRWDAHLKPYTEKLLQSGWQKVDVGAHGFIIPPKPSP